MNQPTHPLPPAYDDEIDLFELAQTLWQEKLLIVACTVFVGLAAGLYCLIATPVYNTSMQLEPARISAFGEYVAAMDNKEKSALQLAQEATEQLFQQTVQSLQHPAVQQEFLQGKGSINTSIPRGTTQLVVTLASSQPAGMTELLEGFVEHAAQVARGELETFMQNLGSNQSVEVGMLYDVTRKAGTPALNKPKRLLVITVGIVAGGMLGIFAALVRSAIRKHKSRQD